MVGEKGPEAHIPLKDGSVPVELTGGFGTEAIMQALESVYDKVDLMGSVQSDPSEFGSVNIGDTGLAKNFFMLNGGTTQAGARNPEEIKLLKQLIELQKEQIDTLKAKDTSPTVNVSVDSDGMIKKTGQYVSERTRRGTLQMRSN